MQYKPKTYIIHVGFKMLGGFFVLFWFGFFVLFCLVLFYEVRLSRLFLIGQ